MPSIGVRELRNQANEIVRSVREEQAEYIVTYHGEPVAVLLPINRRKVETALQAAVEGTALSQATLEELEALRDDIEQAWDTKKSATQIIREGRR
jgi:prevent-host-death family protein